MGRELGYYDECVEKAKSEGERWKAEAAIAHARIAEAKYYSAAFAGNLVGGFLGSIIVLGIAAIYYFHR